VARLVLLDAGPLGLACTRVGDPKADECRAWLAELRAAGVQVLIPAVAEYEVRREVLRAKATARLRELDDLRSRFDRLEISAEALDRAAEFWALLRNLGMPTAADADLDGDAILAGMAATCAGPGDVAEVATTNLRHLRRFPGIIATGWRSITPTA